MKNCLALLLLYVLALVQMGCRKDSPDSDISINKAKPHPDNSLIVTAPGSEGCMEFAAETPNPYTVSNMVAALNTLAISGELGCDTSIFNIRVTHKYIKFKPQTEAQFDSLNDDTTLILFDYPLHRKITKGGTYYRDPTVPEGQPNFQWTCVPIDRLLSSEIPYDILAELYIPEEDPELVQFYETAFDDCITLLIDEALKRTGNFDTTENYDAMTSGGEVLGLLPSKYTPKGYITVFDDRLNKNIGLLQAKVRAQRWFEMRQNMTDYFGHFNVLHKFRYPVNYSIKWERADYHIRSGTIGQAYFNGPHKRGDWYLNIVKNGVSWVYANVHRAAFRYHYLNIGGLKRPGQKNLRYWVYNHSSPGAHSGVNWSEYIKIWRFDQNYSPYTADEIYTTTIHETAHSSHIDLLPGGVVSLANVGKIIFESYAIGVEWQITQLEYRSRGISDYSGPTYYSGNNSLLYPINYGYQYWNSSRDPEYTSLFIDIVDNYNQNGVYFPIYNVTSNIDDQVSGYLMSDLESYLVNVIGVNTFKNELKAHKPNGVTDQQIDNLLNNF